MLQAWIRHYTATRMIFRGLFSTFGMCTSVHSESDGFQI